MGNENCNVGNDNYINNGEIIENDSYEELDLKKNNKIPQQKKQWNNNTIVFSIKNLNFLCDYEEIKEFQNDNKSAQEKSNEKFFKEIELRKEKQQEIKNEKNKEQENPNENVKIEENKKEDKINKEQDVKIDNIENNFFHNLTENKNESKNINNRIKKPKLRPTNTGDGYSLNFNKAGSPKKVTEFEELKNNLKKSQNNSLNIVSNNQKNNLDLFDIKNIIPEYKLNHLKNNEIIYSGTLDKILRIPEKETIAYSQRFCVLTKNYFSYYKSKESFISLNKPMISININNIIRIENTSFRDNTYYFGIIIEVNAETKNLIHKVNSFITYEEDVTELLLGFRTKEIEDMIKWVVVLTYFSSQKKEKNIQ